MMMDTPHHASRSPRPEPTLVELVAALRARIRPARPVYHAFAWRGRSIVYDLLSGTLLEPDPAAFALLRGIQEGANDEIVAERKRAAAPAAPEHDIAAINSTCGVGFTSSNRSSSE